MGRSPTAMSSDSPGSVEPLQSMAVKREADDIKPERKSLSVSTKLYGNSTETPQKMKLRRALYSHLPSVKKEALTTFTEVGENIYQFEDLGESQQGGEVMTCECVPLKSEDGINMACGDNDCINFATSIECMDEDCNCGPGCRNQRFQRCEYAVIDVIQTERKGYGIRANMAIPKHTFIYEYVGEVIEENTFRSRMHDYDDQGVKHFYFMMIQQGEYIDATKKGGLGRFINHSCAPNCYVDKWVVGTKLRMGIFADRNILAGEELTFDYNVDRYGADAQPCYCEEPNCIGHIGGKTQSEAQPKLSHAVKEALGFDDEMDWTTTTSRKRRRAKKDDDEDDDYIVAPQPKPVTEDGVAKIMSTLLQAREKWVITKLLSRLKVSDDNAIWHRVLKMHGYQILGAVLREWREDNVIVTTVLNILLKLPRVTKNKIESSGIENTVTELKEDDNATVKELATSLLQEWATLEMGFRISKRPKNSTKTSSPSKDGNPSDSSKTPPTTVSTGPKVIQNTLHRAPKPFRPPVSRVNDIDSFRNVPRGPSAITQPSPALPPGWKAAFDQQSGRPYYYRESDHMRQWEFPTGAAEEPDPAEILNRNKPDLQRFIDEAAIQVAKRKAEEEADEERKRQEAEREEQEAAEAKAKERAERKSQREQRHSQRQTSETNTDSAKRVKSKEEKKLEILFSSYVPNVIASRFRDLTKDEVKKHARDIVHELVRKEFKYAKDPKITELTDHKKQKIKDFVKAYMNKVMARRAQKEAAKQQQQDSLPGPSESVSTGTPQLPGSTPRDQFPKDIDPDTPASAKTLLTASENDQPRPLSPTEFLKGLERELENDEGELELL